MESVTTPRSSAWHQVRWTGDSLAWEAQTTRRAGSKISVLFCFKKLKWCNHYNIYFANHYLHCLHDGGGKAAPLHKTESSATQKEEGEGSRKIAPHRKEGGRTAAHHPKDGEGSGWPSFLALGLPMQGGRPTPRGKDKEEGNGSPTHPKKGGGKAAREEPCTTWSPTTAFGVAWSNDQYVRPCDSQGLGVRPPRSTARSQQIAGSFSHRVRPCDFGRSTMHCRYDVTCDHVH